MTAHRHERARTAARACVTSARAQLVLATETTRITPARTSRTPPMTTAGTVQGGWYRVQPGGRSRFDKSSAVPAAKKERPTTAVDAEVGARRPLPMPTLFSF